MSIDFKIQNKCDHIINWEATPPQADRKTIYLSYPLASVASLYVRINNVPLDKSRYNIITQNSVQQGVFFKTYLTLRTSTRLFNPLVESRYTTMSTYCPKCAGENYLDDIIYGPSKDIVTVKDEYLLLQTLEKFIITQIDSNPYHTWLGTTLHTLVGSKITDVNLLKSKIYDDIKKAVDDLKSIQAQYVKSGRPVSLGELFGNLLSVNVNQNEADPTTINVVVNFTAQSGRNLSLTQPVELQQLQPLIAS
jgi:hypothetical protein